MKTKNPKTHTIRWNGNKTERIITFTDSFMSRLKESYPESVSLIVSKLLLILKKMTGKKHSIDYLCMSELEKTFPRDILIKRYDYNTHMIDQCFKDGYMAVSIPHIDKDLEFINLFYKIIRKNNGEDNGKV